MLKRVAFIVAQVILVFVLAAAVSATEAPSFPSCSNPQGTKKVSYDSGTHYIVGRETGVSGSDAVYYTGENLIQCFCAEDGSGIQTNWWKISSLEQTAIDILTKLGWYYVPSGADWGLESSPYLAQNANYSCKSNPPDNPPHNPPGAPVCDSRRPDAPEILSVVKSGSKATITWTKEEFATHYTLAYGTKLGEYPYGVPNTGNVTSYTVEALDPNATYYFVVYAVNNCMPSEPSSNRVIGGGSVLGLATTGNSAILYSVFAASLLLTSAGVALRKKAN